MTTPRSKEKTIGRPWKVTRRRRRPSQRLMGGDQQKNGAGYKSKQETKTTNIIASGAGGEDFEHFMRITAKGSVTEIVSAGEPPFWKSKVPLAEHRASKLGLTCGRRFLRCLAWQGEAAICCVCKLFGCTCRARTHVQSTHAPREALGQLPTVSIVH